MIRKFETKKSLRVSALLLGLIFVFCTLSLSYIGAFAAAKIPSKNLVLWLKADAGVVKNESGAVSSWADKSSKKNDFLQSKAPSQPILVANAVNGKPAVRFDGKDDFLVNAGFKPNNVKNLTIIMVASVKESPGNFSAFITGNKKGGNDYDSGFNIDLGQVAQTSFSYINLESVKRNVAENLLTKPLSFNKFYTLTIKCITKSGKLYVNGKANKARSSGPATITLDEMRIGSRYYGASEKGYLSGDIAEVIVYSSDLSDKNRKAVDTYLKKKYAIK